VSADALNGGHVSCYLHHSTTRDSLEPWNSSRVLGGTGESEAMSELLPRHCRFASPTERVRSPRHRGRAPRSKQLVSKAICLNGAGTLSAGGWMLEMHELDSRDQPRPPLLRRLGAACPQASATLWHAIEARPCEPRIQPGQPPAAPAEVEVHRRGAVAECEPAREHAW